MNLKVAALLTAVALGLIGCRGAVGTDENVIVRAGSLELTREGFAALAGVPLDSVSAPERWTTINIWIENAVIVQEGEQRGLKQDPELLAQMERIRAEIYLSRLLRQQDKNEPSGEEILNYYEEHRQEFLRTEDGYLVELYFSSTCDTLTRFAERYASGDDEMLRTNSVIREQRWLANRSELNDDLKTILSGLQPGEWTETQRYDDGCRALRLERRYPAGSMLDLEGARGEIEMQINIDRSYRRREELISELRSRYPVTIFLEDSL